MPRYGSTFKYGTAEKYGATTPASVAYGAVVDWNNDGDFIDADEDISPDVISIDIHRSFADPIARTATVGRCTLILKNDDKAYSPELAPNKLPRREVRVFMNYNGLTVEKFRGFIDSLEPDAGTKGSRRVRLECMDAIALLQDAEILLALQENKRGDQLISSITGNIYTPPGTAYDVDLDTFPFAADTWTDDIVYGAGKQARALSAIRDVCTSDWGIFWIRADGYPVFETRHHRLLDPTVKATLSDTMSELNYQKGTNLLYNEIKVTVYPRTVGTTNEVLWAQETGSIPSVNAGATSIFSASFRDPNNLDIELGGKNVVAPVITTDYMMNVAADGSGADLSADFTVVATVYANHAEIAVTNNGTTVGYVTKLQIRGLAIRMYAPPTLLASSGLSQTRYKSKRTLPIDSILQSNVNVGQQLANFLLGLYKVPPGEVGGVMFHARRSATFLTYARDLEISDRITLAEAQTGVGADYFINAIGHKISDGGKRHEVQLDVVNAVLGNFFMLDVSQLDGTDTLAAF